MKIKDVVTKMVNPNDFTLVVVCDKEVVAKSKGSTGYKNFQDMMDATIKGKGIKIKDGKIIFNIYKPVE